MEIQLKWKINTMSIEPETLYADKFWHIKTNRANSRRNYLSYDHPNSLVANNYSYLRRNNLTGNSNVVYACKEVVANKRMRTRCRNKDRNNKMEI